jgi:membrane protease YdiL (CAAX protease family)
VTGVFLVLTRDRFLDPDRLESTVAGWGVSPEQMLTMLAVMAVLNGTAEELFWRGYLPGRVADSRPDSRPPVALTVVLPAFLYASYHAATIGHLLGETSGVVVMTGGVLGGGLFWGWLRQRTRSVWPALLSHGGAVLAYLAVHFWLTSVGGS